MQHNLQRKLSKLEEIVKIQRNCLTRGDDYMLGMLNGLICAHSVLTGNNPDYACKSPKSKNHVRHKRANKND